LKKILSLLPVVLLCCSTASSQPRYPPETSDSASFDLREVVEMSDSVSATDSGKSAEKDGFREEVASRFSPAIAITSGDIENSTAESVGELLGMRSLVDVVAMGSWWQPEIASFCGSIRGTGIFVDGSPYKQQDLNFPKHGNLDLCCLSLSSLSGVDFLPLGLTGLWGEAGGTAGLNLITRDFDGNRPHSEAATIRGPDGTHRTRVELGRGLTSRARFELTAELRESDGRLANSDYDGSYLWGKGTVNLARRIHLRFSGHQYRTKMGLPLFPDARYRDFRKKVDNWGTVGSLVIQQEKRSFWTVSLRYDSRIQEVKSTSYAFEKKKIEKAFGLCAIHTRMFGDKHHLEIEGQAERKSLESLSMKNAIYTGRFSIMDMIEVRPATRLLLGSSLRKEEGLDAGISTCAGVSHRAAEEIRLFAILGRSVGYPALMDRSWPAVSLALRDVAVDYIEQGNGELKAQEHLTVDLGATGQRGSQQISAYLFGSKVNDFVYWSNVDTNLYFGHLQPVNSKTEIWGANLDLRLEFFDRLSSCMSYTHKRSKDSNRKTRLPFSPGHSLFAYLQFEDEFLKREIGVKVRLESSFLSERFLDEYEQDREPGVTIWNGKITIRFLDFHFQFLVRNITDEIYRSMGEYDMPGRSFWWGIYWEFFD